MSENQTMTDSGPPSSPLTFDRYPEYKDSGIEWLGDIPAQWDVKRVRDVADSLQTGPFGSQLHADEYVSGAIPVINPAHIRNGQLLPDPESAVDDATALRLAHHGLLKDDILFARRGELGRCGLARGDNAGWLCGTGCLRLRPSLDSVRPRFLLNVLSTTGVRDWLQLESVGSTMQNVNTSIIGRIPIPVPAWTEQERIVSFLDRETGKIDALVAKKKELIKLLQEKRTALITHTVTKGLDPNAPMKDSGIEWLGEIPAHWDVVHLRRVIERFVDYRGKTPEKTSAGVPLVTARNIKNQTVDSSLSEEFIPEELYDVWMVRGFPEPGDVVVTTEAPLGESAQIDNPEIALAQRIILLKANQRRITNDYLKYHFAGVTGQMELWTRATGSTALGIKASHFKATRILVPSLVEQGKISGFVRDRHAETDALLQSIRDGIARLQELRSALIAAAVTGKIDVRAAVAGPSAGQGGTA